MVAIPHDSVSPYPVMMFSNPSSRRMRRINSTGMAAAPVTARRSEERSKLAKSGWLRIVW